MDSGRAYIIILIPRGQVRSRKGEEGGGLHMCFNITCMFAHEQRDDPHPSRPGGNLGSRGAHVPKHTMHMYMRAVQTPSSPAAVCACWVVAWALWLCASQAGQPMQPRP